MMDIAERQTSGPSVGKFPAFLAGLIVFIIPCVHIGNVYIFLFLHLHDTCGVYPDVDQTQGDSACLICIFINRRQDLYITDHSPHIFPNHETWAIYY